jgi:putative ABC transport system permease protein
MPFWKIAWRNMEQRALASSLTAVSMALGVAVMIAVIVIYGVAVRQFDQNAQGYHLIVGGKGGRLQLVLNTVYHIGDAPFPIPYSYYQKFLPGGEFAEVTAAAIPQCLGDSYEAPNGTLFRVIGTTPDLFEKINYGTDRAGKPTMRPHSNRSLAPWSPERLASSWAMKSNRPTASAPKGTSTRASQSSAS